MDYAAFRIGAAKARSRGLLPTVARVAIALAAGIALLAMTLVGLFIVLPLLLLGAAASYFYLRRRMRQVRPAPRRAPDDVIDAEYTVIDHR
jgi:hypothetical protein